MNIIKQVGMSESATSATQNNNTACLETFEKDRFSSFLHRHGDATGKPATRDKTRGCRKTSISYETSSNFHSWQHDKRTSFAASPIGRHGDATRKPENRDETCWSLKTSILGETRLPQFFFKLCTATNSTFSYKSSFPDEP